MVTVAWITPFPPDLHGGGGQIRQAHLLLALAARAQVELLSPGPVTDPAVRAALHRVTEVPPPPEPWRQASPWLRRAADVVALGCSRQPIEVRSFRPVRRALGRSIDHLNADLVLVEYAGLAPLLPNPRSGRWILTLHNLPSRMAMQQAAIMPMRRQRWLLARDAAIAAAFERRATAAFDAVIVCSEVDAEALAAPSVRRPARARAGGPADLSPAGTTGPAEVVVVVPNGVDLDSFQPAPLPDAPRIVFTGALYTAPNVDGAAWFCRDVLPLVRRQVPDAQVDVVGARPAPEVSALSGLPGVTIHADVAEVQPFMRAGRVAVVPIRIGSGSRLKALEALASGRPIVGTSNGMEGLELQPGRHFLLADTADAFAAAVVRLLGDDALAASLARAGRSAVEQRYGWPAIAARFAEAVIAIGRHGDRAPGVETLSQPPEL